MDRQLGHMVRLIDDLLDVSRISRNKMELRRSRVPLADVVGSAVETARPLIDAGGHTLAVALNERGVVTGTSQTAKGAVHAFLFTPGVGMRDLGAFGRIAAKALGYFIVVSTLALAVGLIVANLFQPGAGLHATNLTESADAVKATSAAGRFLRARRFFTSR